MLKKICTTLGVTGLLLAGTSVSAFDSSADAIEYRKNVFSLVAAHFGKTEGNFAAKNREF